MNKNSIPNATMSAMNKDIQPLTKGTSSKMDELMAKTIAETGVALTQLAVKGTASIVNKKIEAAKTIKEVEKLRTTYDELINEVLQEREEAVRIAQTYKAELDRIVISDDDIIHLHNTVERVLEILRSFQILSNGETNDSYTQIKELISVDTLKAMQLLGFNYKAAIGEPLTELCANAIRSIGKKKQPQTKGNSKR